VSSVWHYAGDIKKPPFPAVFLWVFNIRQSVSKCLVLTTYRNANRWHWFHLSTEPDFNFINLFFHLLLYPLHFFFIISSIWGTTTIRSFLGHKAASRCFCIVQKNERYFGTKPYAPKKLGFGRFMGVLCTKKLIYEIKIPNL
jgi:hypothetical protein